MLTGFQVMVYLTEYPRPTLRRTAYHDGIGAGVIQDKFGFFWAGDIAVSNQRNVNGLLDRGNGVVLGIAGLQTSAGTAVHG